MLSCEDVKAAISANLDGEESPLPQDVIDAHLHACTDCANFFEQAAAMNRTLALHTPEAPAPDLSEVILDGVESEFQKGAARRATSMAFARVAMVLVAVAWLSWAVVVLLRPSGSAMGNDAYGTQLFIEAVSMRCALAFGLFFAAWQPRLIVGMLPFVGGLWMFSLGMAVRDLITGTIGGGLLLQLVLLLSTLMTLAWAWLSHVGWVMVREALRSLGSAPRSEL
ncbi:zf-HC2 domain-containing protein [Corynebacterium gerontici]|uniref:C2H2-type domain-containing protein n=1 Tax=Corynebacterium gerontici TaxID=2079234 RepID=A0A3G6J4Q1_9CORY|nr:zf-HC2 domain-containing protein [Corynebacterium gerontici]AZA11034.1 hypothetical protein CGERO_03575 [Corynebacterium gerontici]